jgi:ATP-binding protein involved in chromosome partitioning
MRIAIPLENGKLAPHFGHCRQFALFDLDEPGRQIVKREDVAAPPHEPGFFPTWLGEQGAKVVIAGGMGARAQTLFEEQGIKVYAGTADEAPEKLVADYLSGALRVGANVCDHHH